MAAPALAAKKTPSVPSRHGIQHIAEEAIL
eukprot:COSAG02_NODE_9264_length_2273_cov_2.781049_3_plen_29_part_01